MSLPKETNIKSVMRTITTSPSKSSPSKTALRMKVLKQTMGTPFIKSPRTQSQTQTALKRISFKEELQPDSYNLFEKTLKTRDLPSLLKTFSF